MLKTKIHLRDPNVRGLPFCTVSPGPWPAAHLTDDPKQVTCGRCLRMIERRQKHEVKNPEIVGKKYGLKPSYGVGKD